jgi:hypothetical protein
MNMMRAGGIVTLAAMVGMFFVLRRRSQARVDLRAGI